MNLQQAINYTYSGFTIDRTIEDICADKSMVIYTNKDNIEIPIVVYTAMKQEDSIRNIPDIYVLPLSCTGSPSGYASFEAQFKENFRSTILHKMIAKEKDTNVIYYVGAGMVIKDGRIILSISWKCEKGSDENGNTKYIIKYPILRIDPEIFILRKDTMQRFLTGKFLSTALSASVGPSIRWNDSIFKLDSNYTRYTTIRALIEKNPFEIQRPVTPNINTTNEQLIQIALNNIDNAII